MFRDNNEGEETPYYHVYVKAVLIVLHTINTLQNQPVPSKHSTTKRGKASSKPA